MSVRRFDPETHTGITGIATEITVAVPFPIVGFVIPRVGPAGPRPPVRGPLGVGRPATYTADQRAEGIAAALTKPDATPAGRTEQEADYGRRGKGYVFGAFRPATGAAFTHPYPGRTGANWIHFLERVEAWLPAGATRVYAVLDNLAAHGSRDVLLFNLAYPRWEFVFQPVGAAYLNLIEPWWKVLRSLTLQGAAVRDVGSGRGRGGPGDGLLECPPASVRLRPPAPSPPAAAHRIRHPTTCSLTWRTHDLDL